MWPLIDRLQVFILLGAGKAEAGMDTAQIRLAEAGDGKGLAAGSHDTIEGGIAQARIGKRVGDISHAVQNVVEAHGFSVVLEFVGHGVGRKMHEEPQIPNYGKAGEGPKLKPGMTLAIEPMTNAGVSEVTMLSDGWTVVSADGQPSAHFEHTILISNDKPEILTES